MERGGGNNFFASFTCDDQSKLNVFLTHPSHQDEPFQQNVSLMWESNVNTCSASLFSWQPCNFSGMNNESVFLCRMNPSKAINPQKSNNNLLRIFYLWLWSPRKNKLQLSFCKKQTFRCMIHKCVNSIL